MPRAVPTMTAAEEAAWLRGERVTPTEPSTHGVSGYENYGCRCDVCKTGERESRHRTERRTVEASHAGKRAQGRL